ncbi:MAG: hypothetical protein EOO75_18535, partial [Myxococcales bacterium]
MTPALTAVYDELLLRASSGSKSPEAGRLRAAFAERIGAVPPDHESRAARDAAAWEDALVQGGLARRVAATFDDPGERSLALVFALAQRGLFVPFQAGRRPCLRDLWRGGEFVLLARDDLARSFAEVDGVPFAGRIVAGADGCAVLPGRLWLPATSLPLLPPIVDEARRRGLDTDATIEAFCWMEHLMATMSRIKPQYAFRPDNLDRRVPSPRR